MRFCRFAFSTIIALSGAALLPSAHAQDAVADMTYYYHSQSASIQSDLRGYRIVVGKNALGDNHGTQDADKIAIAVNANAILDDTAVYNKNAISITGGQVYSVSVEDNATLNVSGGGVEIITVFGDGATVNVEGGTINKIQSYAGTTNLIGGSINEFSASMGTINWYSGAISGGVLNLDYEAVLNLHGDDLEFSSSTVDAQGGYTEYTLRGTLSGGQDVTGMRLRDYDGGNSVTIAGNSTAQNSSVNFVRSSSAVNAPEPGTLALGLVAGAPLTGAFVRRRRKQAVGTIHPE